MQQGSYHKENVRIAKNAVIVYVRMICIILIGIVSARLVLRALGASDYGLYNVVGGLIAMLNFISTAMNTTTRRFLNIERGKPDGNPNRIFNICLVIHIAFAAGLFLVAETFGMYYILNWLNVDEGKMPDAVFVFQVSTIVACISIINLPYQSLIESFEKFIQTSLVDIFSNLLKLGLIFVLLYWKGNPLRFYAVAMAVFTLAQLVAYHLLCRKQWRGIIRWKPVRDRKAYREVFSFNNYTALGTAAYIGRSQGSNLIVNYFFGTVVNAAFAVAYQLENFTMTSMNRLTSAASPQITQNYGAGNMGRSMDLVYKISRYNVLLMSVMAFCVLIELDFLLHLWLDEVPAGAVEFSFWTMVSAMVRSFMGGTQVLEQATGRIKWFQITNSVMSLACLPLAFVAFWLGARPVTVIWLYLGYTIVYRMVEMALLRRFIGFDVRRYYRKAYLKPALSVAVLIVWYLVWNAAVPASAGPWTHLLGIALTFVISILSAFFLGFYPHERASFWQMVRR